MVLCLVAVPTATQSVCHDVLKVVVFHTAFRACLEPVGRPLWREGKMGGGLGRGRKEMRREEGRKDEMRRNLGRGKAVAYMKCNRRRQKGSHHDREE